MPQYSYATLQDALNALYSRLYQSFTDATQMQWTPAELTGYVCEALRNWNALTSFQRQDMAFSTTANQWWYDLRAVTGTIIPYTVSQASIIQQIQNHLLEPPNTAYPLVWSGSNQFDFRAILLALQRRQNETLGVTACTVQRSTWNAPIAPRVPLNDTVIDIRRVAWLPTPGQGYLARVLRQSDRWASRAFNPFYTVEPSLPPSNWFQSTEPPPSFEVDAVPPVAGNYDVLTVNSGPNWLATAPGGTTIPDDWTWVFKWGALSDLLSREANAKDAFRAEYCKTRYEEGLKLLERQPIVLAARVNNLPVSCDPVRNADDFNPLWQAIPSGAVTKVYLAGNLMACAPAPNGASGISVTVVQNQPIPIATSSYLQVARDDFDTIIDYAQHLAMFKQGGQEFAASVSLYQKFQRKAALYTSKLKEMGFFSLPELEFSQAQELESPRYSAEQGG